MAPASIANLITSFITFWQNVAISINFPDIGIPKWLRNCINFVTNIIGSVLSFFPNLPQFDLRFQMVVVGLGIPIFLDVCVMWFFGSLFKTLFHICDLAAIGAIAYCISSALIKGWSALEYTLTIIGAAWLLIHLFYYFCKMRTPSLSITTLQEISNYYMDKMIPGVSYSRTIEQINESLKANKAELVPNQSVTCKDFLIFLFGIVVIICALICNNTIKVGAEIPPAIKAFVPWIALPLGIILLIVGFLGFFESGRKAKFAVSKFVNRWGLRLLMLLFEILYIPILTLLISHLAPKNVSCPADTQFWIPYVEDSYFDMFETHNSTCQPCFVNATTEEISNSSQCQNLCSASRNLVLIDDNSLLFKRDILRVSGGSILFVIIFILFGIPALWYNVVSRNRAYISALYIFGRNAEEKWRNITSRINSTGIFLFSQYKYRYAYWSVFILFYKLLIMIISGLSKFIKRDIQYLSIVVYLFMSIVSIKIRPSIYGINNFFDSVLYILNTAYSLIPILARYDVKTPDSVMIVLSALLLVVPIVSVIVFICKSFVSSAVEDDPTLSKLSEGEEEKRKKKKGKKNAEDPEDVYNFTYTSLMPLSQCPKSSFFTNKKVGADVQELTFSVNKYKISKKMAKMYEIIDIAIDSATIDFLSSVLTVTVLFATAGFGWYIGALIPYYNEGTTNCSTI